MRSTIATTPDEDRPSAQEDGHTRVSLVEGDTLGSYRIVRPLGSGAMGAVFEAVHEDLGRRVALKVLLDERATRTTARERFFREARAAARVRHPGVVQVHDMDVDAHGTPYLVMDLLVGETLAERLTRGPLAPEEIVAVLAPALEGVASAHEAGVIHRDLKPSNILLVPTPDGPRAVVVDFGVSRLVDEDSDLTNSAAVLGTPTYMSPEQARGTRNITSASDQFSLGAVLYICLSGARPFDGASTLEILWNIQRNAREPLGPRCPSAPAPMVAAIERALSPDASARFATVRDLLAALRASLTAKSDATPTERPRRRPLALVAAIVTVATLAAFAGLSAHTPPSPARLRAARPSVETPAPHVPPVVAANLPPASPPPAATLTASVATPAPAPRTSFHKTVRIAPRVAPSPSLPPTPEPSVAASPVPAAPPPPELGRNRALILGR
jgi:serine/threonine-protein kinase